MKFNNLLFPSLLLTATLCSHAERKAPYSGSRIFWDLSSKTTVFNSAQYSRIIELQSGQLLAVAESGGIKTKISDNMGKTWRNEKKIATNPSGINYAVPDLIQLSDGTILVGFNPRPTEPYSEERRFGIRLVRSTDNGETWSEPIFVYDAQYQGSEGCWEPAFLELPSGEVQCYFANENDYPNTNEQCISMCRSFDKGLTWSNPVRVSFRENSRDGMPVPILLNDKSEIAVIIEDNGWPGRAGFAATTVRTPLTDNWTSGYVSASSSNRSMIFETTPPNSEVSAAPYIRVMPNGETIASYQGNAGRGGVTDLQYFDMFVLVGDENAKNFKAESAPFSLGMDQHSIWNSVSALSDGSILAVGSIGQPDKTNSVQIMRGYPKTTVTAAYDGNITIDGEKSSAETWTENGSQLRMGNVTKNRSYIDFAYDNENLYFMANVVDRNLINTGLDNDGVRLLIDANDVCGTTPEVGMYSLFFDTDGTVKIQKGDNGKWTTGETTTDVEYALQLKTNYYTLEAAIPWSVLGKDNAPTDQRMGLAIEITNKETIRITKEVIPDVDNEASWTWMNFQLEENGGATQPGIDHKKAKIATGASGISVESPIAVTRFQLYAADGRLLASQSPNSQNFSISLPASKGIWIARIVYADSTTECVKIAH